MGMKFGPRMQDFNTAGVQGGTFPNARGRGGRTFEYWKNIEKDLARQRKEAEKQGGKQTNIPSKSRKRTKVEVTLSR